MNNSSRLFTHAYQLPLGNEQVSPELSEWLRNNRSRWRETFGGSGFYFYDISGGVTAKPGDWLCTGPTEHIEIQPKDNLNLQG